MGHGVDEDVFVSGVGAIAYGAEAVESGDAESGGEIAVGAATCGSFTYGKAHARRERFGAGKQGSAVFAFEGRAIEAAG